MTNPEQFIFPFGHAPSSIIADTQYANKLMQIQQRLIQTNTHCMIIIQGPDNSGKKDLTNLLVKQSFNDIVEPNPVINDPALFEVDKKSIPVNNQSFMEIEQVLPFEQLQPYRHIIIHDLDLKLNNNIISEEFMFNLIEYIIAQKKILLISSSTDTSEIKINNPELLSRLRQAILFHTNININKNLFITMLNKLLLNNGIKVKIEYLDKINYKLPYTIKSMHIIVSAIINYIRSTKKPATLNNLKTAIKNIDND